jgi:uncharacterized membrane protein
MKPKTIYLALCVVGALLPYWQFVPWVAQHGMNPPLFVHELFVNRISAFFGMDVLVSAAVLIVFMRVEGARLSIPRRWIPVLAMLLVGVSLGLPLFLYMREVKMETA